MNITRKEATITQAPGLTDGPGTFEAILSAPTKDRDGDTLLASEWKTPLPAKITVDIDHDMSVRGTIGSAIPWIDDEGNLRISGTFASTPLAQEVRTLMAEGHIDKTSVAFISDPATQKDGKTVRMRELLNAAVVAIPSNREAAILEVRGIKAGARNSQTDAASIQSIHDGALALGADCAGAKAFALKDGMPGDEDQSDPVALILGVDAALDEAIEAFASIDLTTLPAEIQQGIALVQAASVTIDEFLNVVGIPDPDDEADTAAEAPNDAAAEKSAAASAVTKAAEDAESDAVNALSLSLLAAQFVI